MRKIRNGTLEERLAKLLFNYLTTPHTTTGLTPGELMFGRCLSTRFDRIFPSDRDRVEESQERQKYSFDKHTRDRIFNLGDLVYVKNFHEGEKWLAGKMTRLIGNVMFEVFIEQLQKKVRRHRNQIKNRTVNTDVDWNITSPSSTSSLESDTTVPSVEHPRHDHSRYPQRIRKPPDR